MARGSWDGHPAEHSYPFIKHGIITPPHDHKFPVTFKFHAFARNTSGLLTRVNRAISAGIASVCVFRILNNGLLQEIPLHQLKSFRNWPTLHVFVTPLHTINVYMYQTNHSIWQPSPQTETTLPARLAEDIMSDI